MDKLKETSNSLNFKSHNFNSSKKYDNVSVKTNINKIKHLEEQENDENIFQEIEKLDNDNLSLAMQQFIDSLKNIKYVTYDDKK